MNAPQLCGSCGSPVFTDVQGQFGYLRRADDKPARTGLNRVGNGYLDLQRLADARYSILPWTDAQRVISQAISQSSPIPGCAGTALPQADSRHRVAQSGLRCASRRTDNDVPHGARATLRRTE